MQTYQAMHPFGLLLPPSIREVLAALAAPAVHAPPNNLSYFARLLGTRSQRAAEVRNSRLLGES